MWTLREFKIYGHRGAEYFCQIGDLDQMGPSGYFLEPSLLLSVFFIHVGQNSIRKIVTTSLLIPVQAQCRKGAMCTKTQANERAFLQTVFPYHSHLSVWVPCSGNDVSMGSNRPTLEEGRSLWPTVLTSFSQLPLLGAPSLSSALPLYKEWKNSGLSWRTLREFVENEDTEPSIRRSLEASFSNEYGPSCTVSCWPQFFLRRRARTRCFLSVQWFLRALLRG